MSTFSEEELLRAIDDRLITLRQLFRSQKSVFSPGDIEFLKSLASISDQLRSFIQLKEELVDIRTIEDYEALVSRLSEKRVKKEIRELSERLPDIRQQDEANRQIRVNRRIIDLEQNPPRCRYNHVMVIREAQHGFFLGCSRFPFCHLTTQLTPEQMDRLVS